MSTDRTFTSADAPADFESVLDAYPVRLDRFEGPLDLLLHLIRKHQVNIYDIPIALITKQYLDYLDLMQDLDLDIAGDFLVMAATLIHIKSRTLLPRPDPTQDDPEDDPREALVRRLLEHQQFKAAAEVLHDREIQRSAQRGRPDARLADVVGESPEPELEVDLFSLMAAFRQVLERARQRPQIYMPAEYMSLEVRIEKLMSMLSEMGINLVENDEAEEDDKAEAADLTEGDGGSRELTMTSVGGEALGSVNDSLALDPDGAAWCAVALSVPASDAGAVTNWRQLSVAR